MDLIDENVDCVVRGGELPGQSLRARHVADLPLGVYAAPGYLQRVGLPAHPRLLEQAPHHSVGYRGSRSGGPTPTPCNAATNGCACTGATR